MFYNKSILVYFLVVLGVVFMMLYTWRRIYGLNCLIKILEKKLSNSQKENRDLIGVLNNNNGTVDTNEAESIMNKIFDDKCCSKKKPVNKVCKVTNSCSISNVDNFCNSPPSISTPTNTSTTSTTIRIENTPRDVLPCIGSVVVAKPSAIAVPLDPLDPLDPSRPLGLSDQLDHSGNSGNSGLPDLSVHQPDDIVAIITADAVDHIPDHESVISEVTDTAPGVYNQKKLSKMNLDKLKELCVSMSLSSEGTKNALITRILAQ